MLKILHTADWHVGRSFAQFEPETARKLARDRLSVVDRILGLADQYDVDAVLCAGDLFDSPNPEHAWWNGLAESFTRRRNWTKRVVLLPGNHDPLTSESVYEAGHPFRRALPDWVRVVDCENFELELPGGAVVYAAPCTSTAGDKNLALCLPSRSDGDMRLRIGMVHGSTFDIEGHATNFPVSLDATQARGLDYLALGDTHAYREIPVGAIAPIVYPSAPEPTSFREQDAGYVALVSFKRTGMRPRIQKERVARWTWREATVRSVAELRTLASEDLCSTVLKLNLEMSISVAEMKEVERTIEALKGTDAVSARAGAFLCDRSGLRLAVSDEPLDMNLPEAIREASVQLRRDAATSPVAQRAVILLERLLQEMR
jgi:DNA repair exonuclease SbcCD nuclease subunit